jgi:hypothetical protein
MKLRFDVPLVALDGTQLKDSTGAPVTLGDVAIACLLSGDPRASTAHQKVMAYDLAQRVYRGGEVELTIDEAKLLKDRIGELEGPLVVGQAMKLLESTASC